MRECLSKGMLVLLAALLLASCQAAETNVTKEDIKQVNESQAAPEANITRYDKGLKIFGRMLAAYNADYLRVQSKPISDATAAGGVPKNLQQMVISALNKIGKRMQYIDYDPTYVLTQDALAERMNPNQRADILMEAPEVLISGAITEYDKGLVNKANSMNLDIGGSMTGNEFEAGIGADSDAGVSRVAIDLQLVDFATQQLVSGVQTSNSITVSQKSQEKEMGFAMFGSGFGLSGSIKQKQGLHAAIRLLVEMSVLELMGEKYKLPYWRCIEGAKPNQEVIDAYREMLEEEGNDAFTTRLKILAYTHGYDMNLMDLSLTDQEMGVYQSLKQKYNVSDDIDLLTQLWLTVPLKEGAKRLRMAKRAMQEQAPQAYDPPPTPAAHQAAAPPSAPAQTQPTYSSQQAAAPATQAPPARQAAPASRPKSGVVLFGTMSDDDFDSDDF